MGIRTFYYNIATDRNRSFIAGLVKIILWVLSWIYFLFIKLSLFLYSKNYFQREKLPLKIISVGNITWGGTGKTPLVEYIARYLKSQGHKVAILSRGYKRPVTSNQLPVTSYEVIGDEAFLLKKNLPQIPILVGGDRIRLVRQTQNEFGVDTVVLDDGFQQWKMKKDLEIVTIDATNPFGNGWLIPRGILREPLSSLKRADIFILNKVNLTQNKNKLDKLKIILKEINPDALLIESIYEPKYLRNLGNEERVDLNFLKGNDVCIFSGIADPDSFKASVNKLQCNIKLDFAFLDHYSYRKEDLDKIFHHCSKDNIKILLTTEKDAVRIEPLVKGSVLDSKIFALVIELKILEAKEKFYERLSSLYRCQSS